MRWIHITDLHIGRNDQGQEIALESLAKSIDTFTDQKKVDAVFITGDIAFSGINEEYEQFQRIVLDPIKETNTCSSSRIIILPGNHDVNCSKGTAITWNNIGKKRQEKFFYDNDEGVETRFNCSRRFESYSNYLNNSNVEGLNTSKFPATSIEISSNGITAFLVLINTAFFSDTEIKDEKESPAPIHAINNCLRNVPSDAKILILGHHPSDHFIPYTKDQFETLLHEKEGIYLHGHLHRIIAQFGNKGLREFGFGAAYQANLHSEPKPIYRNTYAICELNDSMHIAPIQWNPEYGYWSEKESLPSYFEEKSDVLQHGYRFNIPSSKIISSISYEAGGTKTFARKVPKIDGCIWLDAKSDKVWDWLLNALCDFGDIEKTDAIPGHVPTGHSQLRITDINGGIHLLRAVTAHGDKVSYQQIEETNTLFDTQQFESCWIITLGSVTDEARTLANKLINNKSIRLIDGKEVCDLIFNNLEINLINLLTDLGVQGSSIKFLIHDEGVATLVADEVRNKWFCVIDNIDGKAGLLDESHSIVKKVRKLQPNLLSVEYLKDKHHVNKNIIDDTLAPFSIEDYSDACFRHFNKVIYAPLAAVGVRLSEASLEQLYVPSSANIGDESRVDESLARYLSDYVESQNMDAKQSQQFLARLKKQYGVGRRTEVAAATLLYQKFNNLLILGDPGSGKTLFEQNEILLYCQKKESQKSWYQHHIPVFVSLAESIKLIEDENDFLEVCSILAARRGMYLPVISLSQFVAQGRVAFFFDGLDEIGLVSQRLKFMEMLSDFMDTYCELGNRFVLSSRPTAVQPVDVPSHFTTINLKGLTDSEIRTLAQRVIGINLTEVSRQTISESDEQLVNQLIEDCRSNPSIYRMARNPLLLTLLVFIYMNSGAPAAKRHLVYSQAIRTLVTVRHRETREKVPSEADLRKRLGAIGYAIYQGEIGEIPTRNEVINVIEPILLNEEETDRNIKQAIDNFIQEVADATGLLVVNKRIEPEQQDLISFMHHSFLEYYAAQGLLDNNEGKDAPKLILNPKWQPIITLMFGILGDKDDISDLLEEIVNERCLSESITKTRLLVGFDSALESDVPPDKVQKLLAKLIKNSVENGPAKYSSSLRTDLSERISIIVSTTGSTFFQEMLLEGLDSTDNQILAAYIDLVGNIKNITRINRKFIDKFEEVFESNDSLVRSSCIEALFKISDLRTSKTIEQLSKSLDKRRSFIEKYTAIKLVDSLPALANCAPDKIIDLLEDNNNFVQSYAAKTIISSNLDNYKDRNLLDKALKKWNLISHPIDINVGSRLSIDKEYIRELFMSSELEKIKNGIRLLQVLHREEVFIYVNVFKILKKNQDHEIQTLCMNTLKMNIDVLKLITLSDMDYLIGLLNSKYKDVRIAVLSVLRKFPYSDLIYVAVKDHLENMEQDGSKSSEISACMRIIVKQSKKNTVLRDFIYGMLDKNIAYVQMHGFGKAHEQSDLRAFLRGFEETGGIVSRETSDRLWKLANSHKTPKEIKKQALKTFGCLVKPSQDSYEKLIKYIQNPVLQYKNAAYSACYNLIRNSRTRIEYIKNIYSKLNDFNEALCSRWENEINYSSNDIDDPALNYLRDSILEIEKISASYIEFSELNDKKTQSKQNELNLSTDEL